MIKVCQNCGIEFETKRENAKYCSRLCFHSVPKTEEFREKASKRFKGKHLSEETKEKIKQANKGKKKPYLQGENNPNFLGKISSRPEVKKKFLEAVKKRGQPWTLEERMKHSKRMLGKSNAMRGNHHSQETKDKLSKIQSERYRKGKVKLHTSKISKAEIEIFQYLTKLGIDFKTQFRIPNTTKFYDFYFPSKNLLLEYQGDYWHANPKFYQSGTFLKMQRKGEVLVDSIWERDKEKKQIAIDNHYEIMYVWEHDFKERRFDIINEFLDILKDNFLERNV